MQTKLLLVLTTTIGGCMGCPPDGPPATANALDTIIRYSAATRDTIIKYRAAGHRDTIIMHARQVPDSCKKIPRPPDCPEPDFLSLTRDTIIK